MPAPSNLLNVDRSELITICIYSHPRWIGNLIARTCYTLCLRKLHTSTDLRHQPCISCATASNLHSTTMKHETIIIAGQPWHPRLCTQYSASRLTTSLVLVFSPRMRFGWEVGKGHYAAETDQRYGTRRKRAVEERSHRKEDIRKPVLPFARLLSVSHRIHFLFTRSF